MALFILFEKSQNQINCNRMNQSNGLNRSNRESNRSQSNQIKSNQIKSITHYLGEPVAVRPSSVDVVRMAQPPILSHHLSHPFLQL
jgi:hypothetical protein